MKTCLIKNGLQNSKKLLRSSRTRGKVGAGKDAVERMGGHRIPGGSQGLPVH